MISRVDPFLDGSVYLENQQANRKGSNCPICDRSLVPDLDEGWRLTRGTSPRDWFHAHCQNDHRDYLAWKKRNRRLFRTVGIIGAVLAIAAAYTVLYLSGWSPPSSQAASRAGGALTAGLGLAIFALTQIMINQWGIRKFKREWKERGGVPVASFDQLSKT